MQPGLMKERIAIQAPSFVEDEIGGKNETWATIPNGSIWARVVSAVVKDSEEQDRVYSRGTYKMTIRQRQDLQTDMRVVWQGKNYNIMEIQPPYGSGQPYLDLIVTSDVK